MAKKTLLRVVAPGIYGANGPIPVGAEFSITGEMPAGWKGRVADITNGRVGGAGRGDDLELVVAKPSATSNKKPYALTREDGTPGTAEDVDQMDRKTLETVADLAEVKIDKKLDDKKFSAALKAALFPEA